MWRRGINQVRRASGRLRPATGARAGCSRQAVDHYVRAGRMARRNPLGRKTPRLSRESADEFLRFLRSWAQHLVDVEARRRPLGARPPSGPTRRWRRLVGLDHCRPGRQRQRAVPASPRGAGASPGDARRPPEQVVVPPPGHRAVHRNARVRTGSARRWIARVAYSRTGHDGCTDLSDWNSSSKRTWWLRRTSGRDRDSEPVAAPARTWQTVASKAAAAGLRPVASPPEERVAETAVRRPPGSPH